MNRPRVSPALLATTLSALLLGACGSGDKQASQTPQAQAQVQKAPAPQPFNSTVCVNGHCAVIDQNATLLVPFEGGEYDTFAPFLMKDTMLLHRDEQWQLLDTRTKAPLKTLGKDLYQLSPGYFGFGADGKIGIMDFHGTQVQPARFDDVFVGGNGQYIGYELNGKNGILDAHGKQLTDALYDTLIVRQDFAKRNGWVIGERGDQHWIISLKDGTQKQVSYGDMDEMQDNHMVVTSPDHLHKGLVDANGNLTIPLKYDLLGTPAEGLVSFREKNDGPCGYMDYTGKVVIEPRFGDCMPFGKKGALARTNEGGDGATRKYGVIDRTGAWLVQPTYDYAGEAGRSMLGMLDHVPGYASVFKEVSTFAYTYGIYDLNQGRELIPTTYKQLGMLTPDRFVFSGADAPMINVTMLGQSDSTPAVGLMDASGKVLLKPEHYTDIQLDDSGHYLRARDGLENAHVALFDLDGKPLIAPEWQELAIDKDDAVILGYDIDGTGDDAVHMLRAAYDLNGKPLFAVKHTECGAEQLVDGSGKVIWPADPKPYCPTADAKTQAQPTTDG
ncbi:WG containing repeat-containing protein [Dyella jiangningensis]|uniref:WG repeat-containing protein n=1 Tax=Dyella sp. AtDHG13 TaxID=1938897 RepID=UPI00088B0A4F|nr:WG repeat-containing protein [Dyella sp. AtDHG13]PXV54059.1 WG repeat protein [Dyella sp. AtDHG13]SDL09525.1 WG containing repeat-containing protein [Dyella jiangningensis]